MTTKREIVFINEGFLMKKWVSKIINNFSSFHNVQCIRCETLSLIQTITIKKQRRHLSRLLTFTIKKQRRPLSRLLTIMCSGPPGLYCSHNCHWF